MVRRRRRRKSWDGLGWVGGWIFHLTTSNQLKRTTVPNLHLQPLPLFSFSLYFRPACWPLSTLSLHLPPSPTRTRKSVLFLGCTLFRLAPVRASRNPSSTPFVPAPRVLLPSRLPPLASSTHSLYGNSLDFFASRGGVIYLAEVERHPRRWSTKRAGLGSAVRGLRGGISRENRWRRQRWGGTEAEVTRLEWEHEG